MPLGAVEAAPKSQHFRISVALPLFQRVALCKRYFQKESAQLRFRHNDFRLCAGKHGRKNVQAQVTHLRDARAEKIFHETESAAKTDRREQSQILS
jgi:hypothetical protein